MPSRKVIGRIRTQDFNIRFVGLVEDHSCIYDCTSADYSNKTLLDNAWEKVAKELSEPVQDCKERWKNLKASYTRHLRYTPPTGSGGRSKKTYYIAEYMHFLLPFTKSRKSKSNVSSQSSSVVTSPEPAEEEQSETEVDVDDSQTNHDIDIVSPAPASEDIIVSPAKKKVRSKVR